MGSASGIKYIFIFWEGLTEEALLCVAMYLEIGEVFFHTCSAITGF